jgi:hypothetical protein
MVSLKVRSTYCNNRVVYPAGSTIQVDDEQAEFLLRDSPDSFEVVPARSVAGSDELTGSQADSRESSFEGPPVDRMMKKKVVKDV